jgi:hypothetical protein
MGEKEEFFDEVQRLSLQFDVPLTQEEIDQLYESMKELTA